MPYFDQAFGEELDRVFSEEFDLLLGRKTYEIFAAYSPYQRERSRLATLRSIPPSEREIARQERMKREG